jgi:hypothetical protein
VFSRLIGDAEDAMADSQDYRLGEYLCEEGLNEEYLISPRTAQRWRASGEGPRWVRLGRRRVIYRRADVESWLADRTYSSRADELSRTIAEQPATGPLIRPTTVGGRTSGARRWTRQAGAVDEKPAEEHSSRANGCNG